MQKFVPVVGVAISLAIIFGAVGKASAVVVANCSGIYHGLGTAGELNGSKTLPGTDVGNVQPGCQIGDLKTNNVSGTGVFVSPSANPSIFQFEWSGGDLLIEAALGNNGTLPNGVDVELGLADNTLNADKSLLDSIASINFSAPFTFGAFKTLFDDTLAAGTYVIDTYSGTILDDPTYQINFTPGEVSEVPEPGSLAIFGTALVGFIAVRRRRKRV